MTVELTVAISIACALLGAGIGVATFKKNSEKDAAEEGKNDGIFLTEIGYIKAGIDDIKRKQDKQDELYVRIAERVTAVEASAKQAHLRIDRMEEKQHV
ncbi:MAG: hypothetical protein K6T80_06305 [Firmicutes bacterium]|nr:hypothetical protein [Bacillota bacterium]